MEHVLTQEQRHLAAAGVARAAESRSAAVWSTGTHGLGHVANAAMKPCTYLVAKDFIDPTIHRRPEGAPL